LAGVSIQQTRNVFVMPDRLLASTKATGCWSDLLQHRVFPEQVIRLLELQEA